MKKSIFKNPILALVAGLALAISTQSFSTVRATDYSLLNGTWVPSSTISYGENQGQYFCEEADMTCRGQFDSAPSDPDEEPIANKVEGRLTQH